MGQKKINEMEHVTHEFQPIYDKNSKVLMLGTMPSPKSREVGFYYGHPRNRLDVYKRQVHGHTAAELIVERADHTREHMGLATWADAPEGKIKKSDVTVAKN